MSSTSSRTLLSASLLFLLQLGVAQSIFSALPVDVAGVAQGAQPAQVVGQQLGGGVLNQLNLEEVLKTATSLVSSGCATVYPGEEQKQKKCAQNIQDKTGLVDLAGNSPRVMAVLEMMPLSRFSHLVDVVSLPLVGNTLHELILTLTQLLDVQQLTPDEKVEKLTALSRVQQKLAGEIIELPGLSSQDKADILLSNSLLKLSAVESLLNPQQLTSQLDVLKSLNPSSASGLLNGGLPVDPSAAALLSQIGGAGSALGGVQGLTQMNQLAMLNGLSGQLPVQQPLSQLQLDQVRQLLNTNNNNPLGFLPTGAVAPAQVTSLLQQQQQNDQVEALKAQLLANQLLVGRV